MDVLLFGSNRCLQLLVKNPSEGPRRERDRLCHGCGPEWGSLCCRMSLVIDQV